MRRSAADRSMTMAATRREGQRELTGPGSQALTALVLMAIPGAAALGALLDGTPSWIVAFGAASIASMVALASIVITLERLGPA